MQFKIIQSGKKPVLVSETGHRKEYPQFTTNREIMMDVWKMAAGGPVKFVSDFEEDFVDMFKNRGCVDCAKRFSGKGK